MKHFNKILALVVFPLVVFVAGCASPEKQAGTANKQTHAETQHVADQVNLAESANADADQDIIDALNVPDLPAPAKAKLEAAHAKHEAVKTALKPINPDLLPKINDAADQALQAELRAQDAQNAKIGIAIAVLVFFGVGFGVWKTGAGVGVSVFVAGLAAVLLGVVVGIIASILKAWLPWIIGAFALGGAIYVYEVYILGKGWLTGLHSWFDATKSDAMDVPAELASLKNRIEQIASSAKPTSTPAAGV